MVACLCKHWRDVCAAAAISNIVCGSTGTFGTQIDEARDVATAVVTSIATAVANATAACTASTSLPY